MFGGLRNWVCSQWYPSPCGMKYMHKARRDQHKLTTPQPWHRWHLDTYCICDEDNQARRDKTEDRTDGPYFFTPGSSGQLSLIWDLQVTRCPRGWQSSYWAGFMEWDSGVFFLVISVPAPSHAQSIIAHSIMYQSLQTPFISPRHNQTPPPPPVTPREGQALRRLNEDV